MPGLLTLQICIRGKMTKSRKQRRCLLRCARAGFILSQVNTELKQHCLDPVSMMEWNLWSGYYVDIVRDDPYFENQLINNNRSLDWFAEQLKNRRNKIIS